MECTGGRSIPSKAWRTSNCLEKQAAPSKGLAREEAQTARFPIGKLLLGMSQKRKESKSSWDAALLIDVQARSRRKATRVETAVSRATGGAGRGAVLAVGCCTRSSLDGAEMRLKPQCSRQRPRLAHLLVGEHRGEGGEG